MKTFYITTALVAVGVACYFYNKKTKPMSSQERQDKVQTIMTNLRAQQAI